MTVLVIHDRRVHSDRDQNSLLCALVLFLLQLTARVTSNHTHSCGSVLAPSRPHLTGTGCLHLLEHATFETKLHAPRAIPGPMLLSTVLHLDSCTRKVPHSSRIRCSLLSGAEQLDSFAPWTDF
ncbi:hypothetical protein PENSPDRAFT_449699 [Peniophora sp. CONT]|nr:hypothetical protein PENSPDRAFT_449699 [Peniophora sp. CONT]